MRTISKAMLVAASGMTTACASTPDMQVGYYLPTGSTQFKATETIACDPAFHILGAVSATIASTYEADRSRQLVVPIKMLDGDFADTSLAFDFYDDGRLKGLNAESTGQGEAIIKAASGIFTTVMAAAVMEGGEASTPTAPADCAKIAKWGGEKKVLTLTWLGDTNFSAPIPEGKDYITFPLRPDTNSFIYAGALQHIGSVCARVGRTAVGAATANPLAGTKDKSLRLELRQPATSRVKVLKFDGPNCSGNILSEVETADVQVPQKGSRQDIMIPKAAIFGKQSVTLNLSEAGAITKLAYGKTNGAASAFNAAGAAFDSVHETGAERLARLKQEADLIAAQERLVGCLASSKDCK